MKSRIQRVHMTIGLGFIAIFLATGVYMAVGIPNIDRMDHGQRMMMRSAHVYIAMSALINVVMGCYLKLQDSVRRRSIQLAGSALILIAPLVFLVAFFVEPEPARLDRPFSLTGVAALGIGVIFQAFVVLQSPGESADPVDPV